MTDTIRVLQVFHGMDCGGAENMIMNLYRKIDRNKVQFDFLVHTEKHCFFDDEIKELGGNIYYVPYYNVKNHFKYVKELKKFFTNHPEIKVVHGHLGSCAHLYLDVAKKFGCFTIAHSHNTQPEISIKSLIYRLFTYKTRRTADYFMACGVEAGKYRFGEKIAQDGNKYTVLNNAINSDKYLFKEDIRMEYRKEYNFLNDELIIGHIGRFNYQKNHKELIKIFNSFHTLVPNSKLVLVGDGELRAEIENLVNVLGLSEKVLFLGLRRDVHNLLQMMDCFLFPSYYEGLPVTVVEAQAAGLPCVLSDTITKEVDITGNVKYLPLDEDYDVWSNEILKMISKTKRLGLKKKIVDAGYDITTTAQWLQNFYVIHSN